jgi:hypothetical protein
MEHTYVIAPAPDDLLRELEDNTTKFRYDRFERLEEIAKRYEELGDQSKANDVRNEVAAFMLITSGRSFPGYFQPLAVFTNEATLPSRDFFTSERLSYLANRARSTKNPIVASRFADVVWDLSLKKDPNMARIAIDRYLQAASTYRKNNWDLEFAEAIKRAAVLGCLIRDSDRLMNIKDSILSHMTELDGRQDYRFCLDLAEAIAKSRFMELTEGEWQHVLDILDRAITYFREQHPSRKDSLGPVNGPNEHFVRSFYEIKSSLRTRVPWIRAEDQMLAIAESYEREGDEAQRSGNPIAALSFYMQSEKMFGDLGRTDDRDRLRVKLTKAGYPAEAQMREITTEFRIERSKIDEYVRPLIGDTLEDTLQRIAAAPHFAPNLEQSEKTVEELRHNFPLQFIIPRIVLDDEHIVGLFTSEDELRGLALTRELLRRIKISNLFITHLFDILKRDHSLGPGSLTTHFRKWGVCRPRNLEFLERGLEHYFREDYVAALHILVPQFEDILRALLEATERPIYSPSHGVFMLPSLLRDAALNSAAGPDLIRYYQIILVDQCGLNLRNDLAHGLLEPSDMTRQVADQIIYLLLTLTRFVVKRAPQK